MNVQKLQGLYPIIDSDVISMDIEKSVHMINQSPVNIVQYRNKTGSKKKIHSDALKIRKMLDSTKLFIVNDHIDIAMDVADGVHVGQDDYPVEFIRRIIPEYFILGISCHNLDEAQVAVQSGASYIAVGSLFDTISKNNALRVSMQVLASICGEIALPICGIGGINTLNLDHVLATGIKMAASISHIWKNQNPEKILCNMHEKIIHFDRNHAADNPDDDKG
jgi:thiamine-phosphate diphosphorylase